ncbi:MAG: DUF4105 domain-containing protein [Microbacter sp.]
MRNFLIALLWLLLASRVTAITLSDSARISLLSCGPGSELYAKFGHSAIRIYDPANQIDVSFNYGYFDYNTPGFYYKFVRGETDYQLGVVDTPDFLLEYRMRHINVWEQVLNLNQNEKQALFNALLINYEPQNRYYRYNFAFDNCATRPRDMIAQSIQGKLIFSPSLDKPRETFRQMIDDYTADLPAVNFGLHLLFGASADQKATLQQSFFLPERLMQGYATAMIQRGRAETPLVISSSQPVKVDAHHSSTFNYIPLVFGLLLLIVLVVSSIDRRRQKISFWFDALLFGLVGLVGVLIFYMNFFSLHPFVSHNWNLVWANPLDLLFAVLVLFKSLRPVAFYLQYFFLASVIFLLVSLFYLPQVFDLSQILLIVTLGLRSTIYLRLRREYLRPSMMLKK